MRRAFSNPVGNASPLAALAAEPAALTRPVRRPARLLGLVVLAAVLSLWAGPALGQTVSIAHTGSATVKDGKIQLVEGGASTTFQISLSADFISDLKTAHPEAARTGANMFAYLRISRSTTTVTWTTSDEHTFKDRTGEFDISYGATALNTAYGNNWTHGTTTVPDGLWFYLPLDITNSDGSTYHGAVVDSFAVGSFPNTFTIEAEADTTYFENDESIIVQAWVSVFDSNSPETFANFAIASNELTFDLVEGALPAPTGKPTTPANLTATAGKGAVTLTWDPVDATSGNTNLVNDAQITKHQVRQSTGGDINDETWTDIPNSAIGQVHAST